jgi:hypothetical protein
LLVITINNKGKGSTRNNVDQSMGNIVKQQFSLLLKVILMSKQSILVTIRPICMLARYITLEGGLSVCLLDFINENFLIIIYKKKTYIY